MIYRSSTLRRYTETRLTQLEVESLHNTSTIQVDARASVTFATVKEIPLTCSGITEDEINKIFLHV